MVQQKAICKDTFFLLIFTHIHKKHLFISLLERVSYYCFIVFYALKYRCMAIVFAGFSLKENDENYLKV
jgi:hypothetical protein